MARRIRQSKQTQLAASSCGINVQRQESALGTPTGKLTWNTLFNQRHNNIVHLRHISNNNVLFNTNNNINELYYFLHIMFIINLLDTRINIG